MNLTIDPDTLKRYLEMATTGDGNLRAALEHCVSELIGLGYQLRRSESAAPSHGPHPPRFDRPPPLSGFIQDLDL